MAESKYRQSALKDAMMQKVKLFKRLHGFTLPEMAVVLVLILVLYLLLYMVFSLFGRSYNGLKARMDYGRQSAVFTHLLRRDVDSADLVYISDSNRLTCWYRAMDSTVYHFDPQTSTRQTKQGIDSFCGAAFSKVYCYKDSGYLVKQIQLSLYYDNKRYIEVIDKNYSSLQLFQYLNPQAD